ncbi:hypothetical protein [Jiulongibacter sp. NS-SX5]|uniref:hypothetical protein n=1 Tax=Jiulongibacter sp. NS-SX5 TaxID=3463854 RepID=UPI004059D45F
MKKLIYLFAALAVGCTSISQIDRKAVVSRHNVHLSEADSLNSLTVGNGQFAMTVDITGLQSFPDFYENGIPLGTQSEWAWHSYPAKRDYKIEETMADIESHGRKVPYARQWPSGTDAWEAGNYLRQNPHRMHLSKLRFQFVKDDGSMAELGDLSDIDQTLDTWFGEIHSHYTVNGVPVSVITICDQESDKISVQVESELITEGRLKLNIAYPEPLDIWKYGGNTFAEGDELCTVENMENGLSITSPVDGHEYLTVVHSNETMEVTDSGHSSITLQPEKEDAQFEFSVTYEQEDQKPFQDFDSARKQNADAWKSFWENGGMIDFSAANDDRAKELERRMVLSMYLTKVNCGGSSFPQETGLTYNSWYGKPHMEMPWWHSTHWPLWGRVEVLEEQMTWYKRAQDGARKIAERQGFSGVRWQKMTDNVGGETVSSVGSYLLWNQPHPIWFAELIYQQKSTEEVLNAYAEIIENTAEFMGDFAWKDSTGRYILGPGVIPAQERFNPQDTYNPTYELAYWRWALETAQQWRERRGEPRNDKWDEVLKNLSDLPQKDGVYLATESTPDSYTTEVFMTDHPSVLGTYGMLPETSDLDKTVMRATFDKIWTDWQWHDTWGWDFPMTAMTATRLGLPEKAVDALLMPIKTNIYLKNGHNFQDQRLTLYLPGNGGFLTALALMATSDGFPPEWNVQSEGISQMP